MVKSSSRMTMRGEGKMNVRGDKDAPSGILNRRVSDTELAVRERFHFDEPGEGLGNVV